MQTEIFVAARPRLLAVATRLLGSPADAEEAVQDAWLRTASADETIDNPTAWLTTVVSRICLDKLRARRDTAPIETVDLPDTHAGPADEAQLSDAVGTALSAVVHTLAPAERVAFVLHDVFGVPFDEIADILGKSPAATRQIASRARRRVTTEPAPSQSHPARAVAAFLSASRDGDFGALVDLLDPDAMFRTFADDDPPALVHGASAIAEAFMFRATTARAALLDGKVGVVVPRPGGAAGELLLIMDVSFAPSGSIAAIDATLRADELLVVDVS
ncbi:sigma-70 family RNA polymerase sigma factor [Gordonia hydrophobica]|uniref:Sigma-70 family RNA polymerase sigma factor n=1 Tax=Gordonia hydrophobica TaxID=40516 RepID=A0ABZ2U5D3_9ACTN|nr:sigma-70 family RNA polymerase sigma factor [Gordonia hydrophobica]MBM7368630.1 RNA polymerase sigma-70 factor (ECF subfamily) [Gordonia hydrophobica]